MALGKGDCIDFYYDINGDMPHNVSGRDTFNFISCPKNTIYSYKNFDAYFLLNAQSDASRLDKCKNNAKYCSGYLLLHNWEFTSDYLYRL